MKRRQSDFKIVKKVKVEAKGFKFSEAHEKTDQNFIDTVNKLLKAGWIVVGITAGQDASVAAEAYLS